MGLAFDTSGAPANEGAARIGRRTFGAYTVDERTPRQVAGLRRSIGGVYVGLVVLAVVIGSAPRRSSKSRPSI
jgi:hypothetical protein